MTRNWTTEQEDRLAAAWNAGKSSAECAKEAGRKQAGIINKLNRMAANGDPRIVRRTTGSFNRDHAIDGFTDNEALGLLQMRDEGRLDELNAAQRAKADRVLAAIDADTELSEVA